MHLDTKEFDIKFGDVLKDIKEQEIRSPAWGWMAAGAVIGLAASCLKLKKLEGRPIMAGHKRMGK
jgi:hypothetical protein